MSTHSIPELDAGGLRHFALTTAAIVAALFGLILPWLLNLALPIWPWPLAAALTLWGLAAPRSLRPVYRGWMRIGLAISRVTTPLILGLVFLALFVPVGMVMRLTGHDPMKRRLRPEADSYRELSQPYTAKSMEKPY
jgi:Kef-type K+ transport system membrane component KefB